MKAYELASLLHARRTGKGKWTAKCPAHPDRNPSLSISAGRSGVLLKCFSAGCTLREICDAIGVPVASLFYDYGIAKLEPKAREIIDAENCLEWWIKKRREATLAIISKPGNYGLEDIPGYIDMTRRIEFIREQINPQLKIDRIRREKLERFLAKFEWDALWEKWLESEQGKSESERYGI